MVDVAVAPETDWTERVHLWEDDGEVVGIAWYTPDGMAEGMVRAGQPDGPIEDAAFELHRSMAARDDVAELGWFAIDGHETEAARLARHGFAPTEMTLTQWHQTLVTTRRRRSCPMATASGRWPRPRRCLPGSRSIARPSRRRT